MTGSSLLVAGLLAGCLFGFAVTLALWQLRPATPALGPALARLNPDTPQTYRPPLSRGWRWFTDRLVPAADIAVLGHTRSKFLSHMGLAALTGLIAVPTLMLAGQLAGVSVSFLAPTAAGLGFSIGAMVLQYRGTTQRAKVARADYRRGVCVYIDQVALATAAGNGPVASLEQAATTGTGPVFDLIRDAIAAARLRMEPPWERLQTLGRTLEVPALGDLGDIMHSSGTAGAHVYRTLRARATSLRAQIRFDELAAAKASSTALDALGAALVLVLLGVAAYPFVALLQNTL
jgi:tight adherence protein C